MTLFGSLLTILYFFTPFSINCCFFGHLWDLRTKYVYKKRIFSIFAVIYPLVLHNGDIRTHKWHYLNHYWRFCVLTPFFINFWPFLAPYGTLEPNISIRSGYLVPLWLPIHLYDILVKLEHLSNIICIIIDDFVFSTSFHPILSNFTLNYVKIDLKLIWMDHWILNVHPTYE